MGLIGAGVGYNINWIPGTTISNGKFQFIQDGNGNELTAGAYPTNLQAGNINFYAIFPKHF